MTYRDVASPQVLVWACTSVGARMPVAMAPLALVFLGWLGWVVWEQVTPQVESSMVGFRVVDEHTATARVNVTLADDSVRASCLLRAYAEDHTVVGERAFTPSWGAAQPLTVSVRTERRATAVELIGCTAPGEGRPR